LPNIGQNKAEYEACWLMGIPIINPGDACQPFLLLKLYV